MNCSFCATALPAGARFCPACGLPVVTAAGSLGEQRKIVTVLFCDLVGSTALSTMLEAESLRAVTLRYFALMRHHIEAHGGVVEKFVGDAVMAVFGVPSVHEDDALRGACAALDMIAALDTLNRELDRTFGYMLRVRIGVNTGEVVASADQDGRQVMVSGEVVNIAARLEQHAAEGQILLGPDTLAAIGPAAITEPVGPLTLKGKSTPVAAHRLRGVRAEGAELLRRSDTPFVGRERELAMLNRLWRDGLGKRHLITVTGEAGIGKTRLIREWRSRLPGVLSGVAHCHHYRDQASLNPLAVALRRLLDAAGTPTGARDHAALADLLADGTPGPSLSSTCAAVARLLGELAATHPVLLVIDDVQWAYPTLLDALGRIASAVRGRRVLVVGAGRHVPAREPGGQCPAGSVPVEPLTVAESAELARAGAPGRPEAVRRAVVRAEGNPLHLEQLLAALDDGTDMDRVPAAVAAVLAARIDALEPAERVVLDAASVIGRSFSAADIRLLVGETGAPCELSLHELTTRRLVEPDHAGRQGDEGYRFRSGLVRDVTYQGIAKQRRADWHERLAAGSGRRGGEAGPALHLDHAYRYLRELGRQDERTEVLRARAARALSAAAAFALRRADLPWSEDLHRRALDASGRADPWWPSVGLGLGETLLALGEIDAGHAMLTEVIDAAGTAGDTVAAAHARLQLAALSPQPGQTGAADAARDALPLFLAAGDELGIARAQARLGQEQQLLGRYRAAEGPLAEALRHAVAASAQPEQALVLGALGVSLWLGPTPVTDAIRQCRELLAEHARRGSAIRVTLSCPLAVLHASAWQVDRARALLTGIQPLADELGYAEAAVFLPLFRATVESFAGDLDQAERLLRSALAAGRTLGGGLTVTATRELARLLLRQGRDPEACFPDEPDSALSPAEAADELGIRALVLSARAEHAAAVRFGRHAVETAESTDSLPARAVAALDLAEAYLAAGMAPAATEAAAGADALFRRKGHRVGMGRAAAMAARARAVPVVAGVPT